MLKDRKFWLGVFLTGAAIWGVMRGVDFQRLVEAVFSADYRWLSIGLVLYLGGYWSRAKRVSDILKPTKTVPTSRTLPPLVIGFMFNNILPLRVGEFVFAYLLGEREKISRTSALAVVVISRILDGFTILAFLFFGLLVFLDIGGDVKGAAEAYPIEGWKYTYEDLKGLVYLAAMMGFLIFGVVLGGCFFLMHYKTQSMSLAKKVLLVLPARFGEFGESLIKKFISGLKVFEKPGVLFRIFMFNFVPWGLELLTYYFVAKTFGMDLNLRACALIMAMTNLAMILPSAPGGIGLFEFGGLIVFALLGTEKTEAVTFLLVVHMIILMPINFWGVYYMFKEGISFKVALQSERK